MTPEPAVPSGRRGSRLEIGFAVFLTGAAVLVLEIAATRLLSPYYGSTLYTVSSVITVVLGALSLGYYVGGRLADRRPSLAWFYGTIALAGAATLLLRHLSLSLLPAVGFELSLTAGPLLMTPALFFLPSALLGLMSPYAIKLQSLARPDLGSGENAGSVFFWSTLGSICGSLSAGFYLVPALGLNRLLLAVALVLLALGSVGFLVSSPGRVTARAAALLLPPLVGLVGLSARAGAPSSALLYARDGVYQKVQVFEAPYEGRPARQLWLDRSASGVVFLDGDDLPYAYTRYHRLTEVFSPELRRAVALGAGAYSVPKDLLARDPDVVVDAVDIEPGLLPLAERFFGLTPDPRLRDHVADARAFLYRAREPYDLIFADVFHSVTVPVHLTTREYFALAHDRLTEGGLFVGNFVGDLGGDPPTLLGSLARTFLSVFDGALVVAVLSVDAPGQQNFIFVGARRPLSFDPADPRLAGHPLVEIRDLGAHVVPPERLGLDRQALLTDDDAPTELLAAQQIERIARESGGQGAS